ncbi:SDR family oxidoreductase [Actinokineospora bangkokensis]|uniref:Oxidoreductase n=1 Tax=Actinokineospora bangkokensis TaxID=1193682 RepID=A0A1Q9LPJ7_9PSEU|nr:SDR family oxidoreductase [Actinokineospora bangkokensis]OLR93924.1 oxidoreductase [Actinokineospora bangkokensis]
MRGKVVVVTGASSGIGAATARELAARGARLVLGARRADRVRDLARELGGVAVPVDVRDRDAVRALVETAEAEFGGLDVFVANAGVGPISLLDDLRVDDWEAMVDVNLKGVLWGIAAALPVFRRQGRGHFIATASTAALRVVPYQSVYAGTKMAVRAVCEGLRQEAGPDLRVTVVSPGYVETEFVDGVTAPGVREALLPMLGKGITPEAIARGIAWAVEQPAEVDISELVIRPTAQG